MIMIDTRMGQSRPVARPWTVALVVIASATSLSACGFVGNGRVVARAPGTASTSTTIQVPRKALSSVRGDQDTIAGFHVEAPTSLPPGKLVPRPTVVGVQSPTTTTKLLSAVSTTWLTMVWTLYSHHNLENAQIGHYQFDCVGATNYFLSIADPNANNALRASEHIRAHYVPSPKRLAAYLSSLPTTGTPLWKPVKLASEIGPGEIIAVPPAPGSHEPGHAMMTAGPAEPLTNGDYAVLVFDSTAFPGHGPLDSRRWDTRDQPLPNVPNKPRNRKSGLGYGTVEITTSKSGAPANVLWSVGGTEYGGHIQIAQPLS